MMAKTKASVPGVHRRSKSCGCTQSGGNHDGIGFEDGVSGGPRFGTGLVGLHLSPVATSVGDVGHTTEETVGVCVSVGARLGVAGVSLFLENKLGAELVHVVITETVWLGRLERDKKRGN